MFIIRRNRPIPAFNKNRGFTLIEFLVAMVSSIIITGAVIALMVNTLSISSENIRSSRVTQELRATLEIFSRDLRRAGATPNAIDCYAQNSCNNLHAAVTYFETDGVKTCVIFALDRNRDGNADGVIDVEDDKFDWTGFRYDVVPDTIEIKVSGAVDDDNCSVGEWAAITDAEIINITGFSLDTSPSYKVPIYRDEDAETQSSLEVRKVNISISGKLASGGGERTITETIRLRNDSYVVEAF